MRLRDAAFLLTGAGTWVGKSTYLTADPMTLQEGKRGHNMCCIRAWSKSQKDRGILR